MGAEKYAVIVSAENYYNSHHLAYIRNVILVAIGVTSLFALSISVIFSKQVFTPVINITKRVKEIGSQNLHVRLETPNVNDEIGELTATFNTMLDRLETAFETQNNFISNASHELSTPLTTIIGEADLTLSKERDKQAYVDALTVILAEAERLDGITKSLLLLAQTGFNGKNQTFEKIRVDQLLYDVKDTIDKINPSNRVSIVLLNIPENPYELKIKGNKQLLHLAISNIVTNACKYSENRPVEVTLDAKEGKVIVGVHDNGIGIPDMELPYIYDPFFRASNTVAYKGYGIGMPLTRNIMRIHQGEIKVASAVNTGTNVQLVFPSLMSTQVG
jgi:signal transduction histidine kinase